MGTTKAVGGKIIAIQAYLKKTEKSQINNLTLHLKELEKQPKKARMSRRKKIIKIRAELNHIETKKQFKGSVNLEAGSLKR